MKRMLMLMAILCVAGVSWADSYTITSELPTDEGTTNGGGASYYYLNGTRWGAMQFDLSSTDSIDSVTSAVIKFMGMSGGGNGLVYNVWRLTEDFDETKSPWYTSAPAYDSSTVVQFEFTANNTAIPVDVSSLLANNGDKTTFGILFQATTSTSIGPQFYARRWTDWKAYGNYPNLSAEYSTVPEPATMLLFAGGSLGVFLRKRRV